MNRHEDDKESLSSLIPWPPSPPRTVQTTSFHEKFILFPPKRILIFNYVSFLSCISRLYWSILQILGYWKRLWNEWRFLKPIKIGNLIKSGLGAPLHYTVIGKSVVNACPPPPKLKTFLKLSPWLLRHCIEKGPLVAEKGNHRNDLKYCFYEEYCKQFFKNEFSGSE